MAILIGVLIMAVILILAFFLLALTAVALPALIVWAQLVDLTGKKFASFIGGCLMLTASLRVAAWKPGPAADNQWWPVGAVAVFSILVIGALGLCQKIVAKRRKAEQLRRHQLALARNAELQRHRDEQAAARAQRREQAVRGAIESVTNSATYTASVDAVTSSRPYKTGQRLGARLRDLGNRHLQN